MSAIRKHQNLTDLELLVLRITKLEARDDATQHIRHIGEQIAAGSDDDNLFLDLPKFRKIQNVSDIELQECIVEIALRKSEKEQKEKERQVAEEKQRLKQLAQKRKEAEDLRKKKEVENRKINTKDTGGITKPSCVRCAAHNSPCVWPPTGSRQRSCEKCNRQRLRCQMEGELKNPTAKRKAPEEKSVDKGGKKRAKLGHNSEELNDSDTTNILEDALSTMHSALEDIRSEIKVVRHEVEWSKERAELLQGLTHAVADLGKSKKGAVRGKGKGKEN